MITEMTADLWAQVRAALEQALALTAEDRADFLERLAERAPRLHPHVVELLAADSQASELFSIDRWQARAMASATEAGRRIDKYRLVEELGRGGMGTVFLAERADGEYQHRVAIKVLPPGILSGRMEDRFRHERQILARLSHPGIARMFDAGSTEDGLLYAVMEYVEGEPIDQYCESRGLDLRARLRLFLGAAEAVQHAHQQLILHLDIKPANLLVTKAGEPRLLDFGISRMMDPSQSDAMRAEMTMRLLTPRYASPEQAAGEPVGVTSDVFSLGTLLYRLVTGALPYPVDDAAPLEAARMIRETEPVPPSRVARAEWRMQVRGDLELILLKALRKEPERRYPTVAAFAEDIQRFLEARPVRAHRDSLAYRAGRFVRRNRFSVAAATVFLALIAASLAVAIRSAIVARREAMVAKRRLDDVRDLAHSYIFDLDPQLQGIPGTVAVRGFILQKGMKYLDAMASEAGTDDALDYELARGYVKLSVLENSFIYQSLGNKADARAAMDKAVALATASYQRDPSDLDRIEHYVYISANAAMMAEARGDIEGYDRIEQRLWKIGQPLLTAKRPHALFVMGSIAGELATNRVGNGALWNLAEPAAGLEWSQRSRRIMEQVREEFPQDPLAKNALADSIYTLATDIDANIELGDSAGVSAALSDLRRRASEPEFEHDPTLTFPRRVANDYTLATLVLEHRLKEAEAAAPHDRIREMPESVNNSRLNLAMANSLCMQGSLDLELGKGARGAREMQTALSAYEGLLRTDPNDINSAVQIVFCGTKLGEEPLAPAAARRHALNRVIALSREYASAHPEVASAQTRLAIAWTLLDSIDRDHGDFAGAARDEAEARNAVARLRKAVPHQPQAELMSSQLDAIATGKLDHQDACRQREGALRFWAFLNGPQQIEACRANSVAAMEGATPGQATDVLRPSRAGQ